MKYIYKICYLFYLSINPFYLSVLNNLKDSNSIPCHSLPACQLFLGIGQKNDFCINTRQTKKRLNQNDPYNSLLTSEWSLPIAYGSKWWITILLWHVAQSLYGHDSRFGDHLIVGNLNAQWDACTSISSSERREIYFFEMIRGRHTLWSIT